MTKLWTPGDRDRQWQLGYNNLYSIINDSSLIIMPLGDPRYFAGSGTFTTTGDIQATFTPSSDPRTWTTPYNHTQDSSYTPHRLIPQLTFDGSANEFDSPDDAAWSFGADGTAPNEPSISMGYWFKPNGTISTTRTLIRKDVTGQREYFVLVFATDKIRWAIVDNSTGGTPFVDSNNNALTGNVWNHLILTYDGTGGATAADGLEMYVNGSNITANRTNSGTYTAMENTTSKLDLFFTSSFGGPQQYLNADVAGASCCPWIVGKELTADEVNRIYRMQHSQMFGYYP